MANKNKKSVIPTAPRTKKEETVNNGEKTNTTVEVIDAKSLKNLTQPKQQAGLDANHQVDVLMGLKAYFHDDPSAEAKFGKDPVDKINRLTAIGFATAFVQEAFNGDNNWAATMRTAQLEELKAVAPMIGFTIDTKLLPKPDEAGNVVVPAKAVKVTKETKKKLEAEKKVINSKPIIDPTKIENEDQLKQSLTFMLSDPSVRRPYDRIVRATEFLRSYQLLQANGNEDTTTSTNSKSISDLLEEVRVLVGEIPFSTVGLSHFIYLKTLESKSPIFAFCLLRNASKNKDTNVVPVNDNVIAAMVRTLVNWTNEPKLIEATKSLERAKAELAAGNTNQDYVDAVQHNVDYHKEIFEAVTNCPTDFVDNLLDNLNSEDTELRKAACLAESGILKSYYPSLESVDAAGEQKDQLMHDIQQRAGIITNLFRDPLSQDIRYSETNLSYEAPKAEEKKAEEKN